MTDTDTTAAELAVFEQGDLEPATARLLAAQWREAQRLAVTAVVPKTITSRREKINGTWQDVPQPLAVVKATVFAVVRYGSFFGFEPAISLGKIDVIEGRLEARYDALAGLMMDAGHQVRISESTTDRAVLRVRRLEDRGDPEGWQTVSFTLQEALVAGYVKDKPDDRDLRGAWYTRRADMLVSKAIKRACRWITPDVLVRREDAHLVEGASIEQMVGPARSAGLSEIDGGGAPDREAGDGDGTHVSPVTATSTVGQDDEPVDAELVDDPEQRAKAQRGLMAQSTKAFPKDPGLTPAQQKAKQTAQRHAVAYAVLKEHKSANDMTLEELTKVTYWLRDVEEGRVTVTHRDGAWVVTFNDSEVIVPPEAEAA